ncbi:WYL domain-containing protein [Chryseobacterium sp.]|uniref:WYL domain-containing protein n=1 Tax=Chryseobacterium sp. TaxID=1871047 RepID=UPI002FCC0672
MAKNDQMQRLIKIVKFFKSKNTGAGFEDIDQFLDEEFHKDNLQLSFSEKTFQRDRKLLDELFNIQITFNNSHCVYELKSEVDDFADSIFENLMINHALKQIKENQNLILFEKRTAKGIHHFDELVKAVKNQKIITFNYKKHWSENSFRKVIEPYGLKEFRNRWYLIGNENSDLGLKLKIYGLDRISDLQTKNKTFFKQEYDLNDLFKNSFGIVSTENQNPETLILSFKGEQSSFVKSLPLHYSQEIISDNHKELRISLNLVPTYDFYQELLTHAERLTIISPEKVKTEYLKFLNTAKELNEN